MLVACLCVDVSAENFCEDLTFDAPGKHFMASMITETLKQTTVSVLTPAGRGAVAVVVIEGPDSLGIVERFFLPQVGRLAERPLNRIVYGRWGLEPAEDVVVCRRGFTSIEIHCHGGSAAVKRIVGDLTSMGVAEESWKNLLERHELSPIRAAARIALSEAATERTAMILLDQYQGALENAIDQIVEKIKAQQLDAAKATLEGLLARASLGLRLTQPWQVVIAGPPNVGKSTLINTLLGYQRAIVFDQPGTTRDVVTAQTAFEGWPVQLSDTAGLRTSDDPLESAGIKLAVSQAIGADCLILVFDASQPWTRENDGLVQEWPEAIVVHNKCDLAVPARQGIAISAAKGVGIDQLVSAMMTRLIPVAPSAKDAVPFTVAHVQALKLVAEQLELGKLPMAQVTLEAMKS